MLYSNSHLNLTRKIILLMIIFLGISIFCLAVENAKSKVMRIKTDDPKIIRELAAQQFDIAGINRQDHWIDIVGTDAEEVKLQKLGFKYEIVGYSHPLIGTALADYYDPVEISAHMDQVQTNYPSIAKKILVKGPLYENHNIYAMKISDNVNTHEDEAVVIIDGQHHAREVMAAEVPMDMIDYLTQRYATDPQVQNWVNNLEIYVIPSVNPDGAWYMFNTDNNWRKNRHTGTCPINPTDINRNYSFTWGACGGSSGTCTDDTYRGPSAQSEMEAQGYNDFYHSVYPIFLLSYHTYGEYIMWPYGCNDSDENAAYLEMGTVLNNTLVQDSGGTGGWATGPIWDTIYLVDGGSIDDTYGEMGTATFTIELNTGGFQPDYATWRNITVQRQRTSWQFMLDHSISTPSIQGHVTDCTTGLPLDSNVNLTEVTFTHGEWQRQSYAADFGRYFRLAQSNHTYHISFSKTGYITQNRTVAVGTGTYLLDICLPQIGPSWAQYVSNSAVIVGNPTGGDGDAYPDNCETANAKVTVQSVGSGIAQNVQVAITAASSFISITTPMPINAGNIAQGATADVNFTYAVGAGSNKATCQQAGNFNITVQATGQSPADSNSFSFTHEVDVITGNKTWAFEPATGLEGWTVQSGTWALSSARVNTGGSTRSVHSSQNANGQCDVMLSPVIKPAATTQLTIPNWFATEPMSGSWYDRANVHVVQGATRTLISPTSGKLYKTGTFYNWGTSCLIGTEVGWAGNATADMTWGGSVFSLSAYANQNIQIEMRYMTDPATAYEGVYVDDISATNVTYAGCDAYSDTCPTSSIPGNVLNNLKVTKSSGNPVLNWTAVAGTCTVTGYGIYRGTLPWTAFNHSSINCATTGTTYTDSTASASYYYLVVPYNASNEGSYGTQSSGTQRPQGTSPCKAQSLTVCN